MAEKTVVDVVVVGAGLAGLSAALELKELSGDALRVVILEGRERPGGRIRTEHPEYGFLDYGGEFLGLIQNYVPHYLRRFGLPTFPTFLPETHHWLYQDRRGRIHKFPGNDPLDFPGGLLGLHGLGLLDEACLSVRANLEEPWRTPLSDYDQLNALQMLRDLWRKSPPDPKLPSVPQEVEDIFRVSVRSAFSAEPEEISGLFCLYYAAAAGSFSTLVDINGSEGAAEGTRLSYGAGSLVQAFVKAVGEDAIAYRNEVERIDQSSELVQVVTKDGHIYEARGGVIVALPPPVANSITFLPDVSQARRTLMAGTFMGHTIKCFFSFTEPFWRSMGLMGYGLAARDTSKYPIDWTLDCCWEGQGQPPKYPHALMVFMAGEAARNFSTMEPAVRRERSLDQLAEIFGEQVRSYLIDDAEFYHEFDYSNERLSLGGPTALMRPGMMTTGGRALRKPDGRIFWAGTEEATEWCGYMDGAIQSGIRAAGELLLSIRQAQAAVQPSTATSTSTVVP